MEARFRFAEPWQSSACLHTPSSVTDVGENEMTIATLEKKLKPLEAPVDNELLRWLYLHLPPQPIKE